MGNTHTQVKAPAPLKERPKDARVALEDSAARIEGLSAAAEGVEASLSRLCVRVTSSAHVATTAAVRVDEALQAGRATFAGEASRAMRVRRKQADAQMALCDALAEAFESVSRLCASAGERANDEADGFFLTCVLEDVNTLMWAANSVQCTPTFPAYMSSHLSQPCIPPAALSASSSSSSQDFFDGAQLKSELPVLSSLSPRTVTGGAQLVSYSAARMMRVQPGIYTTHCALSGPGTIAFCPGSGRRNEFVLECRDALHEPVCSVHETDISLLFGNCPRFAAKLPAPVGRVLSVASDKPGTFRLVYAVQTTAEAVTLTVRVAGETIGCLEVKDEGRIEAVVDGIGRLGSRAGPDAITALFTAIDGNPGSVRILTSACYAMQHLAGRGCPNGPLIQMGGLERLYSILDAYPDNPRIQRHGCRALWVMLEEDKGLPGARHRLIRARDTLAHIHQVENIASSALHYMDAVW